MNDDDDLMLNFAAPVARPAAKAKGGAAARANGNKRQQPPAAAAAAPPAPAPASATPAAISTKRIRIDSSKPPLPSGRPASSFNDPSSSSTAGPSRPKPGMIISSLFSGAPSSFTVVEDEADSRKPAKPTNAPGDTSTFDGLGLDPLLVAHLKSSRMSIGNRPTGIQRAGLPALINGDAARDVLLHSQTGSGKTLTYLLPILQSLLPLCTETWIDRSVGTLAIILAPTRELARQIYEVAEKLCQLHLSLKEQKEEAAAAEGEKEDEDDAVRRTRWLVPGLLSGGSTKNHEKARLRKGIPILVATPGRLLDHLQTTSSFDVGKCRWLVLDEADRLLEMGFKETLEGILKAMDGRRRLAFNTAKETMMEQRGITSGALPNEEVEDGTGVKWWADPRKVVLCSATLDENVQMLAGTHLRTPQVVRGGADLAPLKPSSTEESGDLKPTAKSETALLTGGSYSRLAAPAQLRQHAVIVPPKLRLVTLIALLRSALSRNAANVDARRVIVFISCTDSVEYYWNALGGVRMGDDTEATDDEEEEDVAVEEDTSDVDPEDGELKAPAAKAPAKANGKLRPSKGKSSRKVEKYCDLFPKTPVFRLHGSLAQSDRIASLKGFSAGLGKKVNTSHKEGAILFCTSVAARGLDLPSVGCVIQLDPPTEGGPDEYLHRIGRTARVGKDGESWIMFLPHEKEARKRLEDAMQRDVEGDAAAKSASSSVIAEVSAETVLKRGFGGRGDEYESRATEVQLSFERWVLRKEEAAALARQAFMSHIRAYATHPSNEKDLFHIRFLHLGHLAKSFALREAPAMVKNKARGAADAGSGSLASSAMLNRRDRKREDKAGLARGEPRVEAHRASNRARLAAKEGRTKDDPAAMLAAAINAGRKGRVTAADADDIMEGIDLSSLGGAGGTGKGAAGGGGNRGQTGRNSDAEARMYAKVRALGRQSKSGGKLAAYGADEFQIA